MLEGKVKAPVPLNSTILMWLTTTTTRLAGCAKENHDAARDGGWPRATYLSECMVSEGDQRIAASVMVTSGPDSRFLSVRYAFTLGINGEATELPAEWEERITEIIRHYTRRPDRVLPVDGKYHFFMDRDRVAHIYQGPTGGI